MNTTMSTDEIDSLLERYLQLLDQYTALRSQLSTLQSSIYQSIARANFSAERGLRYGQDHYDDRMQASRRIGLTPGPPPTFTIATAASASQAPANNTPIPTPSTSPPEGASPSPTTSSSTHSHKPENPLRMFGILTPPTLRAAQSSAVTMVEDVIPRLVAVDAEMREVEIGVRRARKHLTRKKGAEGTGIERVESGGQAGEGVVV